jgi:hypothetical protein
MPIPMTVAAAIRRWQRLTVYTRAQMEEILVDKLIANSARQIGMFLVILAIVSAAIVAFIIYTMTIGKIREIAVLKLIGTRNRTIAGMILQQALGLGLIGFAVGKIAATSGRPSSRNMCCCCHRIRFAGLRCGDADLHAGELAGHPGCDQGRSGGGDRWLKASALRMSSRPMAAARLRFMPCAASTWRWPRARSSG